MMTELLQKQYDSTLEVYCVLTKELEDLIRLRDNVEQTMAKCMLSLAVCSQTLKDLNKRIKEDGRINQR